MSYELIGKVVVFLLLSVALIIVFLVILAIASVGEALIQMLPLYIRIPLTIIILLGVLWWGFLRHLWAVL